MASIVQSAVSDQEMLSQTETEDTDSAETVSESKTGTSSTFDTSLDSTSSEDNTPTTGTEQDDEKQACVSVDLTEVTELEENSSVVGENSEYDTKSTKRRNKDSVKSSKFPNLEFSKDWYKHDCFKAYWKHYNQVMSWCGKHFEVYNKLSKKSTRHENKRKQVYPSVDYRNMYQLYHPYMYMTGYPNTMSSGTRYYQPNSSENTFNRKTRKQKHHHRHSESEVISSETQTETSEEFQMEITPEMLDFFAKTQEHRRQREEAKKATKGDETAEQEHINVEELQVTGTKTPTVEAPKERPGARRTAEMKLLYGKGAPMIHGMETALQMTFDRNTDLKQPKIWPNMPLKVIFK